MKVVELGLRCANSERRRSKAVKKPFKSDRNCSRDDIGGQPVLDQRDHVFEP